MTHGALQEQFDLLAKTLGQAGMLPVYHLMLAIARTESGLERLHNSLEPNQRLPRPDFITLRRYWREVMWKDQPPEGGEVSVAQFRLMHQSWGGKPSNLVDYYIARIDEGRQGLTSQPAFQDWERLSKSTILHSEVFSQGKGDQHFTTHCFDVRFKISCRFIPTLFSPYGRLVVEFVMWSYQLTEKLTHDISSNPAFSQSLLQHRGARWGRTHSVSGDTSGQEINFIFVLDDVEDLVTLTTMENYPEGTTDVTHPDAMVATITFCRALEERLRALEVPFDRIGLVLTGESWEGSEQPEGVIPFEFHTNSTRYAYYGD